MSTKKAPSHNLKGNCWTDRAAYDCKECGRGELCDVCHEHSAPRGECSKCPPCRACRGAGKEQP